MANKQLLPGKKVICEVLEMRPEGYWVKVESYQCFGLLAFDGPLEPQDRVLATFSGWDEGHMLLSISAANSKREDDNWGDLMGVLTAPSTPQNKVLAPFDIRRKVKRSDSNRNEDRKVEGAQIPPQKRVPIIIDGDEDDV